MTPCQQSSDHGELWFSEDPEDQEAAKAWCRMCPILLSCQEEMWNHEFGVWAATTPLERKRADRVRFRDLVSANRSRAGRRDVEILAERNAQDERARSMGADDPT